MTRKLLIGYVILFAFACKKDKPIVKKQKGWFYNTADYNSKSNSVFLAGNKDTIDILYLTNKLNDKTVFSGTINHIDYNSKNLSIAIAQDSTTILFDDIKGLVIKKFIGSKAVEWNLNETKFAIGGNDGNLYVYDDKGTLIKKVLQNQDSILDISWNFDSTKIITVGSHVSIYDFKSDSNTNEDEDKENFAQTTVDWHPDGEFFITTDYNSEENYLPQLQFWDKEGNKLKSIERSKAKYIAIEWSKSGNYLATISDALRIWSKDGKLLLENKYDNKLTSFCWISNNEILLTDSLGNYFTFLLDKKL